MNYRANIDALKRVGADRVLSFSAVGSLKEELAPGTFVLVDQYIDRTSGRESSFFGEGFVAHVSMADPVCSTMNDAVEEAANKLNINFVRGGTYLAMNGPQFSTRAESNLYRSWNADIIGMTNMPEAKLAREAEMAYTTVAMVTDYDCWHEEHEDVSASLVLEVFAQQYRWCQSSGQSRGTDNRSAGRAIPIGSSHRVGTRHSNRTTRSRSCSNAQTRRSGRARAEE